MLASSGQNAKKSSKELELDLHYVGCVALGIGGIRNCIRCVPTVLRATAKLDDDLCGHGLHLS